MVWIVAILTFVIAYAIYTMMINREFSLCPHCRKVGSWRFDSIGKSIDETDDDDALIRSTSRQRCRSCGGEVVLIWSDFEGLKIELPSESEQACELGDSDPNSH